MPSSASTCTRSSDSCSNRKMERACWLPTNKSPPGPNAAVKDAALVGALTRMQYYKLAGYRCLVTYAQHLEAEAEADFFRTAMADERACLRRLSEAELLAVERAED